MITVIVVLILGFIISLVIKFAIYEGLSFVDCFKKVTRPECRVDAFMSFLLFTVWSLILGFTAGQAFNKHMAFNKYEFMREQVCKGYSTYVECPIEMQTETKKLIQIEKD